MKTTITHPTATEIEFHDGSLSLEYTLRDANGNAVGPRVRASVGIADDYVARKLAETMGFDSGPTESRWRVSGDTMWNRIKAKVGTANAHAALAAMTEAQRAEMYLNRWFWNTNPEVRAFITQLQLDPDEILAPDPYL